MTCVMIGLKRLKRPIAGLVTTATALYMASSSAGWQLPFAIEIDRLLARAERQVGSSDYDAGLATLDRILELYRDNGREVPAEFWISDAQLARTAGVHGRAVESVRRYLQTAGQEGEHYWEALELLDDAESHREAQREAEARQAAEEAEVRRRAEEAEARRVAEEREARRRAEEADARQRAAEAAWQQVRVSYSADELEGYVRRFLNSAYREAARHRAIVLRAPREDENGWSRIHYAAALDLPDVVRWLAGRGDDVNAELRDDGASLSGPVIGVLWGVGPTFRNWTRDGETPLHIAAAVGARDAAEALISGGADVDRGTKFDWLPLHYAAWADAADVIGVLLAAGADVNERTDEVDREGKTALGVALESGSSAAARVLRAEGARR